MDTVSSIIQSFESGDTLEPVRYLSTLHDNKTELFLAEEPLEKNKITSHICRRNHSCYFDSHPNCN